MKYVNFDVLDKYIRLALESTGNGYTTKKNGYNFRCLICGDSKKSKKKKRGWILKNKNPWMYHCFNCNCSIPAEHWLKLYFNYYYNEYFKECYKIDLGIKQQEVKKNVVEEIKYSEVDEVRHFIPIIMDPYNFALTKYAIEYCKNRMIPFDTYSKWYISLEGKYHHRLIIPFYDDKGKIYSYQARTLINDELKYINRVDAKNNIYNYYNVDPLKPVIILEGPIDSIFVSNSIALTGVKINDSLLNKFKLRYFLLDNDESGFEKSMALLTEGEYIFLWKKFLTRIKMLDKKIKDINDVIIGKNIANYKFTFKQLQPFFTNSIFDKVYLI
jgi:hypothetical protein